jgi:MTH538 TIR-like domain (DUF1863)
MSAYLVTRKPKIYRLFISHGWAYGSGYVRLVDMLNGAPRFTWRNYSAPSNRPVVDPGTIVGKRKLRVELEDQIRPVGFVIVLAGMYVAYKDWIQTEIDIAGRWSKPIIGVRPWGALRTPLAVSTVADEMVSWNTASIVAAIRRWHA